MLAERLGLDASTVSRQDPPPRGAGLVSVTPDDQDGRARQVELLPAGLAAPSSSCCEQRRDLIRRRASPPGPPPTASTLRGLLDRLNHDLTTHPAPCQETLP